MRDNADGTKQLFFQLSGLTTATNRTVTWPDTNLTIPSTLASLNTNTFTGLQTLNGGLAATTGTFSSTLGVTGATTLAALSATTGTFSGAVSMTALTATTGAFSDALTGFKFVSGQGTTTFTSSRNTSSPYEWKLDATGSSVSILGLATGGTTRLSLDASGNVSVVGGDIGLAATERIYFDTIAGTTFMGEVADNDFRMYTSSVARFRITDTATYSQAVYDSTTASAANVFVSSGGQLQRSTSSLRYKADVQPFNGGLADVLALNPVSFVERKDPNGPRYLGLIAEDLDAAGFTNIVTYDDLGRPDAIQYDRLVVYLINAVKQLTADVDALRAKPNAPAAPRLRTPADATSKTKRIEREVATAAERAQETARDLAFSQCMLKYQEAIGRGESPAPCVR